MFVCEGERVIETERESIVNPKHGVCAVKNSFVCSWQLKVKALATGP